MSLVSPNLDRGGRLRRQAHIYVSTAAAAKFSFQPKPIVHVTSTSCGYCGGIQPTAGGPRSSQYVWCGYCGHVISENSTVTGSTPLVQAPPRISRPLPPSLRVDRHELETEIDKTMMEYHEMTEASTAQPKPLVTNSRKSKWSREEEEYDRAVDRIQTIRFWNSVRASLRDEDEV